MRIRLARSVSGAGALSKRIQASAASNPRRSYQRAASQPGCESVVAEVVEGVCPIGRIARAAAGSGSAFRLPRHASAARR